MMFLPDIQMVDLKNQYLNIKEEIDEAVLRTLASAQYIGGPEVEKFRHSLAHYLGIDHVITCANGTDALQIALMALELNPGDEVIVPAFTYVATAEVIALLRLQPVMTDVDPDSFNITAELIEKVLTPKTKAIVPVHLFGQSADMEPIMKLAEKYGLWVIEDNAQAIGAEYTFSDGTIKKTGTIGHIGCTSFFPSKNLGCFGDGGAIMTKDEQLARRLHMIANHGQSRRYYHDITGVNSRLDAIQAAILNVKLKYLNQYSEARRQVAAFYDQAFAQNPQMDIPFRHPKSTHVFHQYTLKVKNGKRNELQLFLREKGIPTTVYYPLPLYRQKAFQNFVPDNFSLPVTEELCQSVLSLPIHTEMEINVLQFIASEINHFTIGN